MLILEIYNKYKKISKSGSWWKKELKGLCNKIVTAWRPRVNKRFIISFIDWKKNQEKLRRELHFSKILDNHNFPCKCWFWRRFLLQREVVIDSNDCFWFNLFILASISVEKKTVKFYQIIFMRSNWLETVRQFSANLTSIRITVTKTLTWSVELEFWIIFMNTCVETVSTKTISLGLIVS